MRAILILLSCLAGPAVWTFEKDDLDRLPAAFESRATAGTPEGKWAVLKDGDNKVLAQLDPSRENRRYALALAKDSSYRDLSLSVRAKPVSGKQDQAAGLVWRCRDADNYYLARSNVLEKNVRLYRVVNGNRIKFAGKEGVQMEAGAWHTLKVEHRGKDIKVSFNGEPLFEASDENFMEAGKVGVWTKADSITYFDDLSAEEIR